MKICLCVGVGERPITFATIKGLDDGSEPEVDLLICRNET